MTTRWLMAAFFFVTVFGTAALTMTGCDDDSGGGNQDLTATHEDMRQAHD